MSEHRTPSPATGYKRVTNAAIIEELMRNGGIYSAAARRLGISRAAIAKRAKKFPEVQQAIVEGRERLLDAAESAHFRAVKKGRGWAIRFALSTLGKSRGYTRKTEINGQLENRGQVHVYLPDNGRDRESH